jgi:hypothetical protein
MIVFVGLELGVHETQITSVVAPKFDVRMRQQNVESDLEVGWADCNHLDTENATVNPVDSILDIRQEELHLEDVPMEMRRRSLY